MAKQMNILERVASHHVSRIRGKHVPKKIKNKSTKYEQKNLRKTRQQILKEEFLKLI